MKNFILVIILLSALILASIGITADLPYSRVSTEVEQVKLALKFGSGDLNPHWFIHPPFFSYVSFALYGALFVTGKLLGMFPSVAAFERFYFSNPTVFYLIARISVLILMAAAVFFTYKIAEKIFNRETALVASLFMALSPVVIRWSHYASVDIPLMFISLLTFLFCLRILQKGQLRDYIIGGLLIGLSVATKYNALPLVVPYLAAHLCFSSKETWLKRIFSRKLLLGMGFIVVGFFIGSPFSFLDYKGFFADVTKLLSRMSSGEYNFPSWRIDKPGWIYILTDAFPFALTIPIALVTILGVIYALWRHRKADYLFLSLILIAYILSGNSTFIKPRHFLYIFPFMFILGARFITEIIEKISFLREKQQFVIAVLSILLVIPAVVNIVKFDSQVRKQSLGIEAKEWIEKNITPGSKIVSFSGVPLEANCDSLKRQLTEIQEKQIGQGVELKKKMEYNSLFKATYDLTIMPYPWLETYDDQDFDFHSQIRKGIKYFIFTQELEEYSSDPQKYEIQVSYYQAVTENCEQIKEFRRPRLKIEPGYVSDDEYIQIYRYKCH